MRFQRSRRFFCQYMFNSESNTVLLCNNNNPSALSLYSPPLGATENEELHFLIVRSNQSHMLNLPVITILLPLSALIKAYASCGGAAAGFGCSQKVQHLMLWWFPIKLNCGSVLIIPYLTHSQKNNHVVGVKMSIFTFKI